MFLIVYWLLDNFMSYIKVKLIVEFEVISSGKLCLMKYILCIR